MNTELISFPMQDVTAHGILDEKNRDTLHVQWVLTQACNGRCSYCTQWSEMGNTVYVKERVLEIAYKILADRRPYYAFTFTGGEPTLHPHLTDILAYLYRSHTPLGVVVETNGLRNLDYYKELVEIAPKHTFRLTISAHLEKIALKDLCFLIAMTAEYKQHAHVRLILDPNQRKKVRAFYDTLMKLRAVTPFTLDLWLLTRAENPLELDGQYTETDFSWYEDAQKRFDEINTTSPLNLPPLLPPVIPQFRYLTETKDVAWCDQEDTDLELEFKDFYCCLGTNFLRVSSDGTFQGALCCQARPQQPLWKETSHTSQALKILQCASPCCVEERNAVLPKFRQKVEAEVWIRDFEERRTVQKWEAAPLPHPVHPEPSLEDKVRIRLKRMQPESVSSPQGTPQPETIRQRFSDICTIYGALADEDSKDIFLRRIKFLETGDAGYTLLSAYSAGEHPEMPIYREDEAFLETGIGYFRLLHLGGTTDNLAHLTEQEKRITYYQPKMRIALTAPEWCLDIPLHILEKYKGYTLLIGQHGTEAKETWLYAIPPVLPKRYPVIPEEFADKLPLVSVIVPTHNNEDTLKRCLDSALIQGIDRMELIIIDDASTDKTPEIIAEYVRRHPKIVRTLRFAENKGPGPARNAGMDMAYGQYMTFIDSDDMLAEDFLKRGLEVMEKEDADIVAFDMVMNRDGEEVVWGVEPGTWAGEASLEQLLLKKIGGYATYCRLYKSNMLRQYAIEYSDTAVHQDMFFSIRAFYYSLKTVVLQDIGYYRYIRNGSNAGANHGYKKVIAFISFIGFITHFFEAHNLNINNEAYRYCVKRVYEWDRASIFSAIYKADKEDHLTKLLTEDRLLELGTSKEAICCILADYALLHCYRKGLIPRIAQADLDWEKAASTPHPPKTYISYGKADIPEEPSPVLSVILPNYNKAPYLQKCLESILNQSLKNFELIIIDDASTDESWKILQDYADIYSCIRLYRMDYNNRQGIGRNIGIKKARGEYIIFIDSDDYIENNYFSTAVHYIKNEQADMIIFSYKKVDKNNQEIYRKNIPNFNTDGKTAYKYYLKGIITGGPIANIIRRSVCIDNNILFTEYVYHQDHPFISKVLFYCNKVVSKNIHVYTICNTVNSSTRPQMRKYLHLHSTYRFYWYFQNIIKNFYTCKESIPQIGNHILYNVENFLLPSCYAFISSINSIPMTEKDFNLLKNCTLFLRTLLIGYAHCREKGPLQENILPNLPQLLHKDFTPKLVQQPFISVIIPTYNQEEYIERCLKSVLSQSLRNLEVIIINDASTDKTLDLCYAWQKKDFRIRIFSNKTNEGQGYSRNKALGVAQGKYITYVDSDDYILPNFLLHGVSILEKDDEISFIHFSYQRKNQEGKTVKLECVENNKYDNNTILNLYCHGKINSWGPVSKILRKNFLISNNILFPKYMFEDNLFLIKIYINAKYILCIDEQAYVNVKTTHIASAMNPLKITQRHLNGILQLAFEEKKLFIEKINLLNKKELIELRAKSFFYRFKGFLGYIASFANTSISPLTNENLKHIAGAPEFFRYIINDYAKLYALNTHYTPALPVEDTDPQYIYSSPADYLIPITTPIEQSNSITISVIIPAYHVGPYISRCIDSVLQQGIESMEIIIVEDCSINDNTLEICKQYAQDNSKIRLFRTPWNSGLGTVRNLAMQKARGKYITFVDSDDWMEYNFLNQALPLMFLDSNCEVADFSYYEWDDITKSIIRINRMPHNTKIDSHKAMELYTHSTYKNFGAWSKIYLLSFIQKNNILFGKNLNEDETFLIKLYSSITNAKFYDIISYYYVRKSQRNTIMQPKVKGKYYFKSTLENLNMINSFFLEKEANKNFKNHTNRLKSYNFGHHRENILQYIYSCNTFNIESPLTDDAIKIMTKSKIYLRNLIMDYALLSQKLISEKKEN